MAQQRIESMSADEIYARWKHLLEHEIHDELIHLGFKQQIFDLIRDVVAKNATLQETGGAVLDWMYGNYVESVMMHLRRELDDWPGLNLVHLLDEMAKRPEVMTRARYAALWPNEDRRSRFYGPDTDFDQHCIIPHPTDRSLDFIDAEEYRADRERLRRETRVVKDYVEQRIAHRSPGESEVVTLKQIHDAVDTIVELFRR